MKIIPMSPYILRQHAICDRWCSNEILHISGMAGLPDWDVPSGCCFGCHQFLTFPLGTSSSQLTNSYIFLVGGWATPLKNMKVSQLGWLDTQYMQKQKMATKPPTSHHDHRVPSKARRLPLLLPELGDPRHPGGWWELEVGQFIEDHPSWGSIVMGLFHTKMVYFRENPNLKWMKVMGKLPWNYAWLCLEHTQVTWVLE